MTTSEIKRKVWRISRAGSLGRLKLQSEGLPPPRPGEARIAVKAIGLNFADIFACLGLYSATPKGSFIPGLEFSGIVEEIEPINPRSRAKGNRQFRKGDKVMGVTRFGGYASHLNADIRCLWHFPSNWSFSAGAAFPIQGLTAWYALKELGNMQKKDTVLVHSAAGGVGLMALEIIHKMQGKAVGTIGSDEKLAFLEKRSRLKKSEIIVRDPKNYSLQLSQVLRSIKEEGFDLILDSVAGHYLLPGYKKMKPGGRLILFGAGSMMPTGNRPNYLRLWKSYLRRPRLDPLAMISQNKGLLAFNLIWLWKEIEKFAAMGDNLLSLGLRPPHIGAAYPFDQAKKALQVFQSGKTVGKVVLLNGYHRRR